MAYITLDSIITDYLTDSEGNQGKYFKLFHLAFRGMENLGIDFFYRVQSFKLPVNANLTVNLPVSYMNWTKVGILNNRGEIIPMYYNDKLTTFADLSPDRFSLVDDPDSTWLEWNGNTWCNYWNGSGYSNVYGVSSGEPFVGSFKVDAANGVILLDKNFDKDYIMLECLVSPQEGEEYYVPTCFREAMIAWLWWKDGKAKPINGHAKLGSARDAKHEFYNERRNAVSQWKPIRMQEKYQASQEQSRLAIKT